MNKSLVLLFLSVFFVTYAFSQTKFAGRVYDKTNNEPLAFVNIIYNSNNLGTTTDLNGYFTINNKENIEFLRISYLGYVSQEISDEAFKGKAYFEVFIEADTYRLDEVTVLPGENPAHRIINEVIKNRDVNNPEKMTSFSFVQYNKMIFTLDIEPIKKLQSTKNDSITEKSSIEKDSINNDTTKTSAERMIDFFDYQHLFITESITQRRFKYPDNNKEEVLAHRMSGLQNPGFTLLTSQFQSFSFYEDFISIMEKKYVNPISNGSTRRYFFMIEDTMYNERADTVFIISFRPSKGKNFEGLQGVLHINSNRYAIENVRARPYNPDGTMDVVIQQKYEFIENQQWFPVQLNTEIIFNFLQGAADSLTTPIVGNGRSYLSNISLDPDFKRKDFNHIKVEIDSDAHKKSEEYWNLFRLEELSQRDINTYQVIDSIGKEINLDRIMELAEIVATGYIPYKFLNIDPSKIMWYNEYEGYRLGLGLSTNHKMLPWMSIGGYFAYGFKDKAWKYGGETEFFIHNKTNTKLRFGYRQDLKYADFYNFNKQTGLMANEKLRQFFYHELDSIQEFYAGLKFNALRYLNADILFSRSDNTVTNDERYDSISYLNSNHHGLKKNYIITSVKLSLRYAYKERYFQTPNGNLLSMGTDYPILYLNYHRGLNIFDGEYEYEKIEAQVYKKFITKWYGDSHITLTGGFTKGQIPYSEIYYGEGTYSYLNIDNTFNTMRPHEIISDRFANIHFRHDFGSLLFKTKKWKPRFIVTSSAGWGDANVFYDSMINPEAKTMDKGYFESGILLNNIFVMNFSGFGLGVYYRYGDYAFDKEINNFAFKLSATIVL